MRSRVRLERLLVPHDLSRHADRALKFAAQVAGPTGELLVLHAVMPIVPTGDFGPGTGFDVPIDALLASAREYLRRTVARIVRGGRPKTRIKIEIGDAYGRIVANTRGMDAIVMSTLGRTGLSHLVIGSVAEKVVRHSPIPVLTLRPQAVRHASREGGASARTRRSRRR